MNFLQWLTAHPAITGIVIVLAIYLIAKLGSTFTGGKFAVAKLITTADNRLSVSQFQMLLWTFVVAWAYFTVFVFYGYPDTIALPTNLLVLMGFSLGSFVAVVAIAKSRGDNENPAERAATPQFDDLFTGKAGFDLGKFQMFAWTILAVAGYILRIVKLIGNPEIPETVTLPDIDSTMLGLMGLSQAGYLGKKMVGGKKV